MENGEPVLPRSTLYWILVRSPESEKAVYGLLYAASVLGSVRVKCDPWCRVIVLCDRGA